MFSTGNKYSLLLEATARFHEIKNYCDRRVYLSSILRRDTDNKLSLMLQRVCVNFVGKALAVSTNQIYGLLRRVDNKLPMATSLYRHRCRISKEARVVAWLEDLASLHDPQPDKEFTILAYQRRKDVFREYKRDVKRTSLSVNPLPPVFEAYFIHCWKKNVE